MKTSILCPPPDKYGVDNLKDMDIVCPSRIPSCTHESPLVVDHKGQWHCCVCHAIWRPKKHDKADTEE